MSDKIPAVSNTVPCGGQIHGSKSWYVLFHQERRFTSIAKFLELYRIRYYIPMIHRYTLRSDRTSSMRKLQPCPLFPGYMFVYFDPWSIHTSKILGINGAICFLCSDGLMHAVSDTVIHELQNYNVPVNSISPKQHSKAKRNWVHFERIQKVYKQENESLRIKVLMDMLERPGHPLCFTH